MSNNRSASNKGVDWTRADFALVLGGPLFQIMRKAHLSGTGLEWLHRRLIFFPLVCWLPLLALSAIQGNLWGGVTVPFIEDFEAHIRFLIAVPLLISAEVTLFRRTRSLVAQFVERDLIAAEDMPRFQAALNSANRLRNLVAMEAVLLIVVYAVGVLVIWRQYVALGTDTWYAPLGEGGSELSLAGLWFALVSLPVFQFLVLRWYYRIFIWARFLWQVSRVPLRLVPTHPDGAGGIGFLSGTVFAFSPLLMAHGAMLAGLLADRILHQGAVLTDFKLELIGILGFLLCLVYAPLLIFSGMLWDTKQIGKREYGRLAQSYVREFDAKWIRGAKPADEALIGNADIQSLADLASSFDLVNSMRITLVSKDGIFFLACATLVPILPLSLTMMSVEELLKRLFGIFF